MKSVLLDNDKNHEESTRTLGLAHVIEPARPACCPHHNLKRDLPPSNKNTVVDIANQLTPV